MGVGPEVLRMRVRQAEIDGGVRSGAMSGDMARVAESGAGFVSCGGRGRS